MKERQAFNNRSSRLYTEEFRLRKNVSQFQRTTNILEHDETRPARNYDGRKDRARMMQSSVDMYPAKRDTDSTLGAANIKRQNQARNQFATSAALYGSDSKHRADAKRHSNVKRAELLGANAVNPPNRDELRN